MPSQTPRSRLILHADVLLAELREEARYERNRARFQPDDDTPRPPEASPLDSAQARRAMVA
jgi:hypothetical protein